jgi:hypothetical protein
MRKNKLIYIVSLAIGLAYGNVSMAQTIAANKADSIAKKDSLDKAQNAKDSCLVVNESYKYLSSKVHLVLPSSFMGISLKGSMKMVLGERIQLSIVMPIFGSELAKFDITPNGMLLIDRHDKMYVQATKAEMMKYLPAGSDYSQLEQLLINASKPGGRSEVSGSDFGLRSLKDAKVQLYDFATDQLALDPTPIPTKYKRVTLDEFVKVLKGLQ